MGGQAGVVVILSGWTQLISYGWSKRQALWIRRKTCSKKCSIHFLSCRIKIKKKEVKNNRVLYCSMYWERYIWYFCMFQIFYGYDNKLNYMQYYFSLKSWIMSNIYMLLMRYCKPLKIWQLLIKYLIYILLVFSSVQLHDIL